MITCSKIYSDVPFAHRQHRHGGHCARIHGHNWKFKLTFACDHCDTNGFVVDFGALKYIKQWIAEHLDHACVLAVDDPLKDRIVQSVPEVYQIYEVSNASCEGISTHLWGVFSELLYEHEGDRVWISQMELWEDSKNTTCFTPSVEELRQIKVQLRQRSSRSQANVSSDLNQRQEVLA